MKGPTEAAAAWRRSALSRPWVRALLFLASGALLHAGATLWSDEAPGPTIVLTDADVAALELAFAKQTGRPPDAALRRHLVDREIDERLLVAEARRRGWHRSDPVVQRRLIQNQRFLEADAIAGDELEVDAGAADGDRDEARIDPRSEADATLLERAYMQGMDRTDVVVRRRLLERIRLAVAQASRREAPSQEELEVFRVAHLELFRKPARLDLVQIYLSRDRHGDALDAVAQQLALRLRDEAPSIDAASELGDPSLLPTHVRGASRDELARRFGDDFADAAFASEDGAFRGPIESTFGLHFVFATARTEERDPPLGEIEAEVRARFEREREKAAWLQLTRTLRSRAVIDTPLEGPSPPDAGESSPREDTTGSERDRPDPRETDPA